MIYKSLYGTLCHVPHGNAVAGLLNSERLLDPQNQQKPLFISSTDGKTLTVADVLNLVPKAASLLRSKYNVKQGDVVALYGINDIFTPILHYATISLGAIVSPANIMYTSDELCHQLKMTEPRLLVVFDPAFPVAQEAARLAKVDPTLLKFSSLFGEFAELLKDPNAPTVQPVYVDNKKFPAYYCFSSGTSGLPKGVITTHRNILANTLQVACFDTPYTESQYTQGMVLPMSHIFGLNVGIWSGTHSARTTVVFPKFDLEDFIVKTLKYDIKVWHIVPPIILLLGKSSILSKYPKFGETVVNITSGAAPISKETIQLLSEKCPKIKVTQGYGLTETTPVTHLGAIRESHKYDPSSIGWLVPGAEAKLVDPETGKVVSGRYKSGELWVRGPMIMAGYLYNEEATKDTLTSDGWLKTGDVAMVGEHEQFYIVDRIKELIKSNGHQVAPAELESILLTNDSVIDVAVIGVDNEFKTSEAPRAYLVLAPGAKAEDVINWFNNKVAKHKRLWGGAVVVNEIPKSASGKILRRNLKRRNDGADVVMGAELANL